MSSSPDAATTHQPEQTTDAPAFDCCASPDVVRGDRITIDDTTALEVEYVEYKPDGQVRVNGPRLNGRGKPYASAAPVDAHISGPPGGSWDWYDRRKPANPQRPQSRRRLIRAEGDGNDVYRVADAYAARAVITCARERGKRAESYEDPSVTLTVLGDGRWTVEQRAAGWDNEPTTVAYGHVDDVPTVAVDSVPEQTILAWVSEAEIIQGTVYDLGRMFHAAHFAEVPAPRTVYAPTTDGAMVPVRFEMSQTDWDANSTALATLRVTLAPGVTVETSWTVDGRG